MCARRRYLHMPHFSSIDKKTLIFNFSINERFVLTVISDFFSAVHSNIRFPDARINGGGPLPTDLSGPAGINGDADGQYNFNSSFLEGINPYAGPKQGRMGSDRNYQQIPHRVQYSVPSVEVPSPHGSNLVSVSHPIDNGDVAFIAQFKCLHVDGGNVVQTLHPIFCNIVTVNYLLAGMHIAFRSKVKDGHDAVRDNYWVKMWRECGVDILTAKQLPDTENMTGITQLSEYKTRELEVMTYVFRHHFIPFGICSGSEKQGGQSQVSLAPVQGPVGFVSTLTVDGQNRDLVNTWNCCEISGGDILCYELRRQTVMNFTLNHYYKGPVSQSFNTRISEIFQVTPCIEKHYLHSDDFDKNSQMFAEEITGYWKIAQSMVHRGKSKRENGGHVQNDHDYMQGQLLQVIFAPVWKRREDKIQSEIKLERFAKSIKDLSGMAQHIDRFNDNLKDIKKEIGSRINTIMSQSQTSVHSSVGGTRSSSRSGSNTPPGNPYVAHYPGELKASHSRPEPANHTLKMMSDISSVDKTNHSIEPPAKKSKVKITRAVETAKEPK